MKAPEARALKSAINRICRVRRWSGRKLADHLEVGRSMISHVRSGAKKLSKEKLEALRVLASQEDQEAGLTKAAKVPTARLTEAENLVNNRSTKRAKNDPPSFENAQFGPGGGPRPSFGVTYALHM